MSTRAGLGAPAAIAALVPAICLAVLLAACAAGTARTTFPPLGSTPQPAGNATAATSRMVTAALAGAGLQALEAPQAYRPPEGALLAAAPRTVLKATLPDDPGHGYIVIYALGSPGEARAAASDHAAYISSGVGKSLYPFGTRFVLRIVGSTVVFYHWSPETSSDLRAAEVADAIQALGTEVQILG